MLLTKKVAFTLFLWLSVTSRGIIRVVGSWQSHRAYSLYWLKVHWPKVGEAEITYPSIKNSRHNEDRKVEDTNREECSVKPDCTSYLQRQNQTQREVKDPQPRTYHAKRIRDNCHTWSSEALWPAKQVIAKQQHHRLFTALGCATMLKGDTGERENLQRQPTDFAVPPIAIFENWKIVTFTRQGLNTVPRAGLCRKQKKLMFPAAILLSIKRATIFQNFLCCLVANRAHPLRGRPDLIPVIWIILVFDHFSLIGLVVSKKLRPALTVPQCLRDGDRRPFRHHDTTNT